tara:strand:- start:793 stop:1407 length:615 start_codon:yes stop_codon:yes gene_type:complete
MENLVAHWNKAYQKEKETLGWYQAESSEILKLIDDLELDRKLRVHISGAGRTTLVKSLINRAFQHLVLSDISDEALRLIQAENQTSLLTLVQDNLGVPLELYKQEPFDLWIDRAVLHFLTAAQERLNYFQLLKEKTNAGAYIILAQFSKEGALKCSGLDVCQYDLAMYQQYLGEGFKLVKSFDFLYTNPNGDPRPYIYALFQKS